MIDKGLGPRAWEDVLETSGEYIDVVKLGWGTAYVTPNLQRKLEVLRDKPVVIGGTFFEVVYAKGQLDEYKAWLRELGLTHVEISDGTIEIPRERKLELIADFARDFTVLSEVGSKDSSVEYTAEQWTRWLQEELDAGAWKVITEAREGGTAGIFDSSGGMRTELIGEIADAVDPVNVIFEAPTKAAQAWFVKEFGPEVNLGNIPPDEVIPLETLRRGLRGDTLKEVLLASAPALPELDVEAMAAEEVLRWAHEQFGEVVPDVLVAAAELRRSSTCVSELGLDARRRRARHARAPSPRRTRRATGWSSATARSKRGPFPSRSTRSGRTSGRPTPTAAATSARSSRSSARSTDTTRGSPASAASRP